MTFISIYLCIEVQRRWGKTVGSVGPEVSDNIGCPVECLDKLVGQ